MPRTIAIVGCGLIGGSLLRALAATSARDSLVPIERDPQAIQAIRDELGLTAQAELPPIRDGIVVLATPLPQVLELLATIGSRVGEGTLVTDVAGLKAPVLAAAAALPRHVRFVGGHPMAGREIGGFSAGSAELFRGRTIAVCPAPGAGEEAIAAVESLWTSVGGRPLRCEAEAHDAAVARVSHLPFLVAAALAQTLGDGDALARELAAGGARDTSRVATDASIRPVVQANPHVTALAREVGERLQDWAEALEARRPLDDALASAADARKRLFP